MTTLRQIRDEMRQALRVRSGDGKALTFAVEAWAERLDALLVEGTPPEGAQQVALAQQIAASLGRAEMWQFVYEQLRQGLTGDRPARTDQTVKPDSGARPDLAHPSSPSIPSEQEKK